MAAFPLLGFLWGLLHEPFLQWHSLSATLRSLPSKNPWAPACANSGSSVVISSCPQLLSAAHKELLLPSSTWSKQNVAQPLSISVGISPGGGYLCSCVDLPPQPVLLHSPPPAQPLCSLWLRKQSLWQVKEVPAPPGGGPAGLHLIMAVPPHPSPLSLLL